MTLRDELERWLAAHEDELRAEEETRRTAAETRAATAAAAAEAFGLALDRLDTPDPTPAPADADHPTADDLMAAIRKDTNA